MFSLNKQFIVNTTTEFPVSYFNATTGAALANTSAAITTALGAGGVKAVIPGIGTFYNGGTPRPSQDVLSANAYRATPAAVETHTFGPATASTITTTTAPAIDTLVYFVMDIFTTSNEVQFGRDQLRSGSRKVYQVVASKSAASAAILAGQLTLQLHNAIAQESTLTDVPYTSVVTYTSVANGAAYATSGRVEDSDVNGFATVTVTLTAKDEHIFVKSFKIEDDNGDISSEIVTLFDPETAGRTEGLNTATLLRENTMLLTDVTTRPYGTLNHELPQEGALYTEINFVYEGDRIEQNLGAPFIAGGGPAKSRAKFNLYLKEDSCVTPGVNGYAALLMTFLGVTYGASGTAYLAQTTSVVGNDTKYVQAFAADLATFVA